MPLNTSVNINQGICGCDGSFAIDSYDGTPPYSYSIDGGISFKNTPLFTNLCAGAYTVIVQDSLSGKTVNTIFLTKPNNPISYNVYLITTSSTLQNNGVTLTTKYETVLNVTPSLPDNSYLTFDLLHTNISKTSPTISASTITTNSSLVIDSITILPTSSVVSTGSTYNSIPGCQNQTVFIDSTSDSWNNITYSGSTSLLLTTTTSIVKNVDVECYQSTSEESYSISNLKIYGCSCCNAITI